MDDEEAVALVVGAQGGDTMAMNDLLDHLGPYVARICGPIALDDSAEAAQEALVRVFRSLRSLHEPKALFGWVRTIAVREAVLTATRQRRTTPADLAALPARGDPQLAVDVGDVLRRLSPQHRSILVLRDLEGLDERSVAEVLLLAEGTVKSRLHRARASFRKAWTT